jgi:hypothetical protein
LSSISSSPLVTVEIGINAFKRLTVAGQSETTGLVCRNLFRPSTAWYECSALGLPTLLTAHKRKGALFSSLLGGNELCKLLKINGIQLIKFDDLRRII